MMMLSCLGLGPNGVGVSLARTVFFLTFSSSLSFFLSF